MRYTRAQVLFFLIPLVFAFSCGQDKTHKEVPVVEKPVQRQLSPDFNADSAYDFVQHQVDFGPRVPNTRAHDDCAAYLVEKLKTYTPDVIVQSATLTAFDGTTLKMKNIFAAFNPAARTRVLLFAHWDTRPWADRDTANTTSPGLGADDGASGVGVLLEVARQLSLRSPLIGVDIAFFDAEDWGKKDSGVEEEDSYALGTQYWAKNPHKPGYTASFGILLDMVGARGAQFRFEGNSKESAGFVLDKVWKTAARLGYSDYFLFQDGGWVTDDHVYVNKVNIPSIDIIHNNLSTRSGFPAHWHTHADDMKVIDRNTLKAVGQTLLEVIYSEGQSQP